MRNSRISSEILLNNLDYKDGKLYWKEWKKGRRKNLEVGTINNRGYVKFTLCGAQIYCHRAVWIMHNGQIPEGMEIDHINHDRTDNRIENLRLVVRCVNGRNLSLPRNNTSGHIGVYWNKSRCKFKVSVRFNGKHMFGGWHDRIESAIQARDRLLREFGFHENHGRRM